MRKAPRLSLVNVRQKPPELPHSRTSSLSSGPETATSSVVPPASSVTSTVRSWLGADSTREAEYVPYSARSDQTKEDLTDSEHESPEPPESQRMIIAIDYGTTYTGFAYAAPAIDAADTNLSEIMVVRNMGRKMTNEVKIPSAISYSVRTAENERQFGADISPNGVTMINTKLELDVQDTRLDELNLIIQVLDGMKNLNFNHIKASRGLTEYTWRTPEEIVKDYLEKAFKSFWDATHGIEPIKLKAQIDVIITIPVNWSYRARNSTLRAIRNAGFNKSNFPGLNRYIMVSEPEAAAIYTARFMKENGSECLKENECFILCDAGGGTVDVVGYRVKQLIPGLELEQMTIPTGGKCGSNFINNDFKQWLQRKIGENYTKINPESDAERTDAHTTESGAMRDLMKAFEAHKKGFHRDSANMHVDLPNCREVNIDGIVEEGELTITSENMRSFFDPHVDWVIELIQGHINQIEHKNSRVRAVLLIGGFSESKYLQQELDHSITQLRGITLHRPDTSWSAVVQGAVLYGMERASRQDVQELIPCPRYYGIKLSDPYSRGTHDTRDVYKHELTNQVLAGDHLTWLIRKGDLLQAGEKREIEQRLAGSFRAGGSRIFELPIFEYIGDRLPDRYKIAHEEVSRVTVLTADFAGYPLERFERKMNPHTGITYFEIKFTCKLIIKGMDLSAELWWYGRRMDEKTITNIDKLPAA